MLEYFALFLVFFVFLTLFYGIIVIHDIPYEIAHKRNHPHQDAIHVAGWVSLFTLHAIWPFLWIWATLYKPDVGWGVSAHAEENAKQLEQLKAEVAELKSQIKTNKSEC
ncbi:DUF3302 domain-containing protein [Vibrio sp. 10N.261.46.E12]|uniref:DUF3302 domain-containing protein n=1 Tax=unclassified Vibrio TaxID=2614977 RepID=UPI00097861C7|nr:MULTISPECIES: DUF3302 domain-containing protein [unclassified Vibrio]OMO37655.1 hypothetical protein BH584_21640 [Vibrio sp. 10N.261.45.E1]PMJ19648.1 hypothetical protein BCU27_21145 [Vibrio sp. 10N.286.45.B6]PML93135.1 hypothetical protein BCT66_24770 [Vibrio sp. 10N.261.49.E11]PMM66600.1 hypothetical protein BCT48_16680 [Vibrio sp. 10N.261.46.F12]PMM86334.1 hypothetical protein BCT46_08290 [Vibrio sp. 10N.261.46.E8]